jgi:hypothetical protein
MIDEIKILFPQFYASKHYNIGKISKESIKIFKDILRAN